MIKIYKTIGEEHAGRFDSQVNSLVYSGWTVVKFDTSFVHEGTVAFIAFMEKEVDENE